MNHVYRFLFPLKKASKEKAIDAYGDEL